MAPSRNKYRAELTLADVQAWGDQMRVEYDIEARVTFRLVGSQGRIVGVEVALYEQGYITEHSLPAPLATDRGEVLTKAENPWPAVMLVCARAWARYLDNPWGYTYRHRQMLKRPPWE